MNILIVSENFLNGGLETQINSTVQSLKGKINFFFAIKNYNEKWNFKNVYTGFYFSGYSTINQFCQDVDKLIQIITENNIDIVHVHPFFSFFPAVFAAKICGKPVAYTYHGIGSYNFTYQLNDTLLFNMLLDYELDKIFCVSSKGNKIFENIIFEKNKIVFLPNSININQFKPAQISNNKSWALISRLDDDKINAIEQLIKILDIIDIQELHIFGYGSKKEYLEKYLLENNLNNKVFLEGHSDTLHEELSINFNGVIGIGRVIMEAISMDFPTILIGFNKIAGVVDASMYNFIKDKNFTNKYLPNISLDELKEQIQQVYNNTYDKSFYASFREEYSSQTVSNLYYTELKNINYSSLLNLDCLYNEIKTINNEEAFYNSIAIYNLFKKYFSFFIRQSHQKNLFIMGDNLSAQQKFNDKVAEHVNSSINSIENKISNYDKKLDDFSENTMTYNNLKRKLKYKIIKK